MQNLTFHDMTGMLFVRLDIKKIRKRGASRILHINLVNYRLLEGRFFFPFRISNKEGFPRPMIIHFGFIPHRVRLFERVVLSMNHGSARSTIRLPLLASAYPYDLPHLEIICDLATTT